MKINLPIKKIITKKILKMKKEILKCPSQLKKK